MRAVAAVVGIVMALTATPASAQPAQPTAATPSSGWRAAVRAALAFGHAEGKAAALARVAIPTAPATRQATDAALDKLEGLASAARDAYMFAKSHGSPFWAVAAEVRIGDTFVCQADKIVDMPLPPQVPPSAAADYRMVFEGLVSPLRDEGRRHWEAAAKEPSASRYWSRRASERLAGTAGPDC